MTISAVIFLGPSLDLATATRRHPELEFRPPAARGDVYRAALEGAAVIGIVDGVFEAVPSIWHKEVIFALEQGVQVVGSSSMGALRAAELDLFGMRGIGRVYELVSAGVLDDDDVALTHAPGEFGYVSISTPLVNIRCTLDRAVAELVVSADFAGDLITAQKQRFYPDRTRETLREDAVGVDPTIAKRFLAWNEHHAVDQKRADAMQLLEEVETLCRDRSGGGGPRPRLERSASFEAMAHEERGDGTSEHQTFRRLREALELGSDETRALAAQAQRRAAARDAACAAGFEADQDSIDRASDTIRERLGLFEPADVTRWLGELNLSSSDYAALVEREAFRSAGESTLRTSAVDALDEMRLDPAWQDACRRLARTMALEL